MLASPLLQRISYLDMLTSFIKEIFLDNVANYTFETPCCFLQGLTESLCQFEVIMYTITYIPNSEIFDHASRPLSLLSSHTSTPMHVPSIMHGFVGQIPVQLIGNYVCEHLSYTIMQVV